MTTGEVIALIKAFGGGSGGGTGGGVLVVNVDENYTFDKTATEVYTAFIGGTNVLVCTAEDMDGYYAYIYDTISEAYYDEQGSSMYTFTAGTYNYNASTGSDYPVRGR